MSIRGIDFDTLCEICKYKNTSGDCIEEDNISGKCIKIECPIWGELDTTETEDD